MQDMNVTSNKDTSECYFNNKNQSNMSFEARQDITCIRSERKRKKRSFGLGDAYFNGSPEQREQVQSYSQRGNDKSTIELQGIETALQLREQIPTNQTSAYLKGYSQDNIHDTSSNEIDLFQKTVQQQNNAFELPPLRIQIRPSMKTRQDSVELKSTNISNSPSPGLKRWRKVSLVMKSIQAFQKSEIKNVQPGEIEEEIKNSPSPRKKKDESSKEFTYEQDFEMIKILDNYRRIEELCQLCQSGSPQDLERIKNIFQNDPRRYIRSPEDPEHLVNKQNSQGLFPLYIACMNQNIESHETCLEVASRWRYVSIVQILLEYEAKFETKDIEKSKKACEQHQEISELLHEILLKRSKNIFKYCFPCIF